MTIYYVTTSGSDSNNGLTEGTAFATPGYAAGQARTTGDIVYVKEGTYNLTTTTANVSGGVLSIARAVRFEGYKTTIQDRAANPVISFSGMSLSSILNGVVLENGAFDFLSSVIVNITIDGTNNSSYVYGINVGSNYNAGAYYCKAINCKFGFAGTGNNGGVTACEATGCDNGFYNVRCLSCFADSCSIGFYGDQGGGANGSMDFIGCVSSNNTSHGFYARNQEHVADSCTAYANGGHGFLGHFDNQHVTRSLSVGNAQAGFALVAGANNGAEKLWYCADYNNTSGRLKTGNTNHDFNPIVLTADPFVSASTGDFRINNVTGGGAKLRQIQLNELVGVNGVFDIGAIDAVILKDQNPRTSFHPLA